VQLIEVDPVGAEASQAVLDSNADPAPRRAAAILAAHVHTEFRGNDRGVARSSQRCSEHLFAPALAVDVSRVEECDALVECGVDHLCRSRGVEPPAEVVAADSHHAHLQRAIAERASHEIVHARQRYVKAVRLNAVARRLAPTASHEGPAPEPAKPQEEAIAQRVAADPNRPARRDSVISVRTLVTAALIVLGVVALVAFLASIIDIVLVVLVAIVFAEGIRPLVADLHRRRVPTPVGILAVYVAILAFIAVMVLLLVQPIVSEAQSLASHFPTYQRELLNWFSGVEKQLHFNVDITKQVSSLLGATQQILFAIGGTIFSIIVDFVLVLVVGFLWLVSSDRLKAFAVDLFPRGSPRLGRRHLSRDGIPDGRLSACERDQQPGGGSRRRRGMRRAAPARSGHSRHLRGARRGNTDGRRHRGRDPSRAARLHSQPGISDRRAGRAARHPAHRRQYGHPDGHEPRRCRCPLSAWSSRSWWAARCRD